VAAAGHRLLAAGVSSVCSQFAVTFALLCYANVVPRG